MQYIVNILICTFSYYRLCMTHSWVLLVIGVKWIHSKVSFSICECFTAYHTFYLFIYFLLKRGFYKPKRARKYKAQIQELASWPLSWIITLTIAEEIWEGSKDPITTWLTAHCEIMWAPLLALLRIQLKITESKLEHNSRILEKILSADQY